MILVTGATGNVGRELVPLLLQRGERVRVLMRDSRKATEWGDRVEVAPGDFTEPDSLARAAGGATSVFLMSAVSDVQPFRQLVAALKRADEPRVVFLSSILAKSPDFISGRFHRDKEDVLRQSGLRAHFVRPSAFMSNSYQWERSIRAKGVVYNPMGSGRSAPVAPEDIAALVAEALLKADLPEVLEVTGGESVSVPEQVKTLSDVLGRPLRCINVPIWLVVRKMIQSGIDPQIAAAVGESFEAVRSGRGSTPTGSIGVLGRRPTTFREWSRAHAARFTPDSTPAPPLTTRLYTFARSLYGAKS